MTDLNKKKQKAFTLVEVVLYIGLFGFIFTTIISFVFLINEFNTNNKYQIDTEKTAVFVTEHLNETFKKTKAIDTNNSTFDDDNGVLTLILGDDSTVKYYISDERATVQTDSSNFISSGDLIITKFKFQRIMEGSTVTGVIFDMTLGANKNLDITRDISDTYVIE